MRKHYTNIQNNHEVIIIDHSESKSRSKSDWVSYYDIDKQEEVERAPYNFYWDFYECGIDERDYNLAKEIFMLFVKRQPYHNDTVDYEEMARQAISIADTFNTCAREDLYDR